MKVRDQGFVIGKQTKNLKVFYNLKYIFYSIIVYCFVNVLFYFHFFLFVINFLLPKCGWYLVPQPVFYPFNRVTHYIPVLPFIFPFKDWWKHCMIDWRYKYLNYTFDITFMRKKNTVYNLCVNKILSGKNFDESIGLWDFELKRLFILL